MIDLTGLKLVQEHIELACVDSTNRFALDAARIGLLITAQEQTAGRGRKGRSWFSPLGENIYMTLTVGSPDPHYPLVTGVAVRSALADMVEGEDIKIKWPNDILIQGRKVCGILCEARGNTAALGIGVNVNQTTWPDELSNTAISLKLVTGKAFIHDEVIQALVLSLDQWFTIYSDKGFEPVRTAFLEHGLCHASPAVLEDGTLCMIVGLSPEGFLEVEVNGERRTIVSGDVLLAGPRGAHA